MPLLKFLICKLKHGDLGQLRYDLGQLRNDLGQLGDLGLRPASECQPWPSSVRPYCHVCVVFCSRVR